MTSHSPHDEKTESRAADLGPEHTCNGDPMACWAYCPMEVAVPVRPEEGHPSWCKCQRVCGGDQ